VRAFSSLQHFCSAEGPPDEDDAGEEEGGLVAQAMGGLQLENSSATGGASAEDGEGPLGGEAPRAASGGV